MSEANTEAGATFIPVKLYGTTTSPFVRRVRIVAAEVGEPIELINTATDDGQAELKRVSPIWKVPVAEIAELATPVLFDSRSIVSWLTTNRGWGRLKRADDPWREANLVNAIDAALESAIQVFYLQRDGIPVEGNLFAKRQFQRIEAIFGWIGEQVGAGKSLSNDGFDIATASLVCTLDWMDFRKTYATANHPELLPLREQWHERTSVAATRPHV